MCVCVLKVERVFTLHYWLNFLFSFFPFLSLLLDRAYAHLRPCGGRGGGGRRRSAGSAPGRGAGAATRAGVSGGTRAHQGHAHCQAAAGHFGGRREIEGSEIPV